MLSAVKYDVKELWQMKKSPRPPLILSKGEFDTVVNVIRENIEQTIVDLIRAGLFVA